METEKELSARIHYNWFNKCRTCLYWNTDRDKALATAKCQNDKSPLFNQETSIDGHCEQWDSYDIETALEVIDGKWDYIHAPFRLKEVKNV